MSKFANVTMIAMLMSALPITASASTITWDGGGSGNVWTTGGNWSDDNAPSAGNAYVVSGAVTVESPDSTTVTFNGDSLTLNSGSTLRLFRTNGGSYFENNRTFASLSLNGATVRYDSSNGSIGHIINGPVSFSGTNTFNGVNGNFTNRLTFTGALSGTGTLNVTRSTTGTARAVRLTSAVNVSGLSTDWSVTGAGSSDVMELELQNLGWGGGDLALNNFSLLTLSNTGAYMQSTSDVTMTSSAAINLGSVSTSLTIDNFTLNGHFIDHGVYTTADLTAFGFGGTFSGSGTLIIRATPTPAALPAGLMLMLGVVGRRRR
ncbi:MAG: hypothetical protein GC162_07695 [Planctomycetes bacterium]|nr:hypothetical protein [Planctomycetota bacterium]